MFRHSYDNRKINQTISQVEDRLAIELRIILGLILRYFSIVILLLLFYYYYSVIVCPMLCASSIVQTINSVEPICHVVCPMSDV